jgi:hypothetical protein
MTEYIHSADGYRNREPPHEPKPDSVRVTVARLSIGDIVLINDYRSGIHRSATVSLIEQSKKYPTHHDVTTVDGKGRIEVHDCSRGKIWLFERQCSQETRENVEERGRNISLRRDIQRLERKVEDLVTSMDWFKENGGKNPKMPDYRDQVFTFLQSLGVMYDDVGKDLSLPARSKRKKKR